MKCRFTEYHGLVRTADYRELVGRGRSGRQKGLIVEANADFCLSVRGDHSHQFFIREIGTAGGIHVQTA